MATWYQIKDDRITLTLHVQPGAKQSAIAGLHGDALKIRLAAPPIEGRANEALLEFIAQIFQVPQRNVSLIQGAQSRHKRVEIRASKVDPETLLRL